MFIECSLNGNELHSHNYYANTHLFKKFIADSPQTESKQKANRKMTSLKSGVKIIKWQKNQRLIWEKN